ncbi:MAG: hypothetical protein ABDH20_04485 [Thermus sp.]
MLRPHPPTDLAFLADLLRRYPVRLSFRGQVLPEGPLRGEKLGQEGDLALYWEGPPPAKEVQEALGLLLRAFAQVLALRERELALLKAQEETARLLGLLLHEIKNPLMSVLGALENRPGRGKPFPRGSGDPGDRRKERPAHPEPPGPGPGLPAPGPGGAA